MKTCLLLLAAVLFVAVPTRAQDMDDHEAVRLAVLDYVEAIYNVEPERIHRSVSTDLAKVGYWRPKDATAYQEGRMAFDELVQIAETWNKKGRVDAATAPKEVEVFDVMDQTATARLKAHWGVDYMHLAKRDGRWMIVNVLWQSYPPEAQ